MARKPKARKASAAKKTTKRADKQARAVKKVRRRAGKRVVKRSAATIRRLRQLKIQAARRRWRVTSEAKTKPSRTGKVALPVVLFVADGWGLAQPSAGNAVALARTPNFERYWRHHAHTRLQASGEAVGLPAYATGGSEVGHLTMGAGRIVYQDLSQIDQAIRTGAFIKNKVLLQAMKQAKRTKKALHLMGLLSDAGIHSHIRHLAGLLYLAKKIGLTKVYVHVFADGRDVPEQSVGKYLHWLTETMSRWQIGTLATIVGRYYAMDRDNNWARTQRAYNLLVEGKGTLAKEPLRAIKRQYQQGVPSDYYLEPIALSDDGKTPRATIQDGDSLIFFNFRSDRARQLTHAFCLKQFSAFKERRHLNKLYFVGMTVYDDQLKKMPAAFSQPVVKQNLGEVLSKKRYQQLRVAETEKYAHVTYFFNSQRNDPYPGEKRILVPSLKVASYAEAPTMSARGITEQFLTELGQRRYHFMLVNLANPDLVGHSGKLDAAIKAVEVVDECLGRIAQAVLAKGGVLLFTADHGNAEVMRLPNGDPNPSHTNNQVPLILISNERGKYKLRDKGGLADLAPTILELLGVACPKVMTGRSLLH